MPNIPHLFSARPYMGGFKINVIMFRDANKTIQNVGKFVGYIVNGGLVIGISSPVLKVVLFKHHNVLRQVTNLFHQFNCAYFYGPRPLLYPIKRLDNPASHLNKFLEGIHFFHILLHLFKPLPLRRQPLQFLAGLGLCRAGNTFDLAAGVA